MSFLEKWWIRSEVQTERVVAFVKILSITESRIVLILCIVYILNYSNSIYLFRIINAHWYMALSIVVLVLIQIQRN